IFEKKLVNLNPILINFNPIPKIKTLRPIINIIKKTLYDLIKNIGKKFIIDSGEIRDNNELIFIKGKEENIINPPKIIIKFDFCSVNKKLRMIKPIVIIKIR